MPADKAVDAITYMLAGKLHKYMAEAWLGGANGLDTAETPRRLVEGAKVGA